MSLSVKLLILGSILGSVKCANILMVHAIELSTHFPPTLRIAKELVNRGHNVTMISYHPLRKRTENYTDVRLKIATPRNREMARVIWNLEPEVFLEDETDYYIKRYGDNGTIFEEKSVQRLMRLRPHFDLVIITYASNEAYLGFGVHFKAPVILLAMAPTTFVNNIFANPEPATYISCTLSRTFLPHPMHFFYRLFNVLAYLDVMLYREYYRLPNQRAVFKKYIKTDLRFYDVLYNVSLMLTTMSHVTINYPAPIVPAIIEIAGYHIQLKGLPSDLQHLIDNAADGVIYFSMGSFMKGRHIKPEVRDNILKAFAKIKQLVLWKLDVVFENKPENVIMRTWFPQQDILAHPNVKAFIFQGGLISLVEAVYFGVPIIGIPSIGDQKNNVDKAVSDGYALRINPKYLNEESLSAAIEEILTNPKYKNEAMRRSKIIQDKPLKPMDTAMYWIEHVIEHRGAPHLRSAALELGFFARNCLDFTLSISSFLLFLVFCIVRSCFLIRSQQREDRRLREESLVSHTEANYYEIPRDRRR